MTTRKKPPRSWDIDNLLDLGKQSEGTHLKAVPVLILENWIRGERQEGVANYVRTKELARRLERSKLVAAFKPRATSNILAALIKIQNGRNLTRPPLIESQGGGICWMNLPHYEPLLQEYRQIYRERYPEDYRKLFPEGEPGWERPSLPTKRAERKEAKPIPPESATLKKPPRPWDIDDLLGLGRRGGVTYIKAVPVLLLERWVLGGREEEVADWVKTKDVARRLEGSKLVAFKPKGTSTVISALVKIQNARNLTRPPLIESQGGGWFWLNFPHYEPLLQEYRQVYRERHPEDYAKLFPGEEPEWEPARAPKKRPGQREDRPVPSEPEKAGEIHSLLAPMERTLREREQAIDKLTEENQKLRAELVASQSALQEEREAPPSTLSFERRIADEELRNDCAELLETEKYRIDAVRRASVVLEERLRKAAGGTQAKAKYGAALVLYALDKDSGRLVISEVPAEQEGVYKLFGGAFAFVRNPPAHKKVQYTETEAWQAISLIDYLLSLLRQAKLREKSSRAAPRRLPDR